MTITPPSIAAHARAALLTLGLAAAYWAAAQLALWVPFRFGVACPIWFASGIAVSGLFLLGRRHVAGIALGALALGLQPHAQALPTATAAVAAVLEAVLAVSMLREFRVSPAFSRFRDVVALVAVALIAALPAAGIGSVGAAWARQLEPAAAAHFLVRWWLRSALGIVLVVPFAAWVARYRPGVDEPRRALEMTALVGTFILALALSLFLRPEVGSSRYPLAFLLFPCVLWAAVRFGPGAVSFANLAVACATLLATVLAVGPFAVGSPENNLLLLQAWLATLGITGLTLAAIFAEREASALALDQRQRELRTSVANVEAILQSFPDQYLWIDADDRIRRRHSPAHVAGFLRADLSGGRPLAEALPPHIATRLRDACAECRERGEVISLEFSDDSTGEERFYEARHSPLDDGRVLAIVRDVTAARRVQGQLQQSQKMEAIGRLAGGVAHDFNNLLTAMQGYGELLEDSVADRPQAREWARELLKAIARATALTRKLLAMSRRQVVAPRPIDLGLLTHDMADMLRRVAGETVRVVIDMPLAQHWVCADQAQIEQVIVNLCVNARDAMPAGGTLRLLLDALDVDPSHWSAPPGVREGRWVRLRVADDGEGMDEPTLARAFEPFFTTKSGDRGSGLGLSIVYGIVRQSDGEVCVTSAPGQGTTVAVFLPGCRPAPAAAVPGADPRLRQPAAGRGTLLLVENEATVRRMVESVLRRAGFHVLTAAGGDEAIALAAAHADPIDLLLTDVVMPGLNGREVADRLVLSRPGLRVMFMSGYSDHAVFGVRALRQETPYLLKPFTTADLLRMVEDTLRAVPAAP